MRYGKPIIIVLAFVLLMGCWDRKELNDVAVVIGVGLDKGGEQQFTVTAQVIKPSPPKAGGSGGSEIPTWSLSASGVTIMDAIAELNRISPRRLYWPHLQVIIFGEELARSGIAPVLTWFERDRDSRSGTYIAVTRGNASDLLNQKIELGNVPAKAMAELIDTAMQRQITSRKTTLRDFMSILATPGIDAVSDILDPEKVRGKKETYDLRGGAVFRQDKMVGILPAEDASAFEMVSGEYKDAILNIACPEKGGGYLSFVSTDFRRQLRVDQKEGVTTFYVHLFIEGNLSDQSCRLNIMNPKTRSDVEAAIEQKIKGIVQGTFKKTVSWKADVYGVGRELRRYYPAVWHEVEKEWDAHLSKVKLEVSVDAHIRRIGLVLEPTPEIMK